MIGKIVLGLLALFSLQAVAATGGGQDEDWTGTPQMEFMNSEIVTLYQCTSCHTIGERGGTVGPILNQVGTRRDKEWLRRWISDPQEVKPGTKMPKFDFTPEQLEATVDYLANMKTELHTDQILAKKVPMAEMGQALFEDYGCVACHRFGSEGRFVAPDLTWIGVRKTEDWEKTWLSAPEAFKPGTFMPNFHIPAKGVEALAAFLHTQKGQHNDASQQWEFRTNFFLGNTDKERGELVFRRFGCWSCHGESAVGKIRNPNMAPDETMPGLRKATNKYTQEQFSERLNQVFYPTALDESMPKPPFYCPDYGKYMDKSELGDLYAYLKSFAPKKSKWKFK